MILTDQEKEFCLKLKQNLEFITQNNTGFNKKEIFTIAINRLYQSSNLKNKSKSAFQKQMKALVNQQKSEFQKFM